VNDSFGSMTGTPSTTGKRQPFAQQRASESADPEDESSTLIPWVGHARWSRYHESIMAYQRTDLDRRKRLAEMQRWFFSVVQWGRRLEIKMIAVN
jgi:hypothetical protein